MPKKKKKQSSKKINYALLLSSLIFGTIVLSIGLIVFSAVKSQICANSLSRIKNLSGQKTAENTGVFMGKKVTAPQLPEDPELAIINAKQVLGASTGNDKHIWVSLNTQHLYAYQGSTLVYSFPISSGKWHPTPTGDFHIWIWLKYTRMTGGDPAKGTYYDLPNVPFVMYFSNAQVPGAEGYSLHGAYWHNNFGHPMSHGCINLPVPDAEQLYYWTNPTASSVTYPTADNPGTLITIYGDPPANEVDFID
jgi:hypothetical protein